MHHHQEPLTQTAACKPARSAWRCPRAASSSRDLFWEDFPCRKGSLQPADSPISCRETGSQESALQGLGCGGSMSTPAIKSKLVLEAKALTINFCIETSGA